RAAGGWPGGAPSPPPHDIAAAKVLVPRTIKGVVDEAIQIFGGAGLAQDTPLAMLYAQARYLQIADGPDQVHRRSLARAELAATPDLRETPA
uniref:acyl-CoA dehydrogenase family protein n=1 Tax=Nocardia farcinica TaxID=37329 RepID=UPI0024579552